MVKKFLKLDGDKLSQVLEFRDGEKLEIPLNKDGSVKWYKDEVKKHLKVEL